MYLPIFNLYLSEVFTERTSITMTLRRRYLSETYGVFEEQLILQILYRKRLRNGSTYKKCKLLQRGY